MAVKKVESFNLHETPAINQNEFDVETYLNANWGKTKEAVNNNAEELMQAQKDISTLKEDNKTNKSSIDVLEKSNETINKSLEDIDTKDKKQDEDIKANKESIEELKAENLEIKVENERLRNDIKSIAVVNEVSGESIHLEDSSEARCEIEIDGNHQQETREGYNKLDSSEFINSTQNGVTLKVNLDGTLTLNGTATADTTFRILRTQKLIVGKENLKVIINQLENAIKTGTIRLVCQDKNYENTIYSQIGTSTFYNNLKEGITYNIFLLTISSGTICNNLKLGLVISENKTDYEQYGASPSLDYPSPVKSVGDNVNLFPGWEMGTIDTATGNKITDPYYIRSVDFIPILPNIDYTIYSIDSFGFNSLNTALRLYDKDKKYLGSQYLGEILEKNLTFKITNLDARFMIPTSTNGLKNVIPGNAKVDIKLEKGIIATPYSPYNCGSAKIDIFNENIFPNLSNKSVSDRGITLSYDGNTKEFCAKGITTAKEFYCNISFKELKYLNANKSYIFSIDNPILQNLQMQLTKYGVLANAQIDTQKKSANITQLDKAKPNSILLYSNNIAIGTKIDWTFKVQIKEGTIATNYVQHDEQSYLVDVQQEILEGDYLDLENEKEHHEWGKVVLDGTETWLEVSYGFVIGVNTVDSIFRNRDKTKFDGYSNYLKVEKTSQAWTKINYCGWNTDGAFWIREDHTIAKNIDDFKAYLKSKYDSGNPVVVYYPLATPVELDFTEAQKAVAKKIKSEAHTYKNITNILAESAEVNPIVNVKYLKDTETEHKKLQAQIDEIKELLSSTETSALLVNNLEKDLRMEVE